MRRFWAHMARRARNEEGFTLIELLVVLAILAVLAALAIPRIAETKVSAKTKVDSANHAILQSAVERYYIEEGQWPTATGGAGALVPGELVPDYLAEDFSPSISNFSVDANGLLTP
ncbi:MAG: prepilin-type N-terminal cleavage/methylation domain-containing protein [Bacillota bacterium]